MDARNKKSDEHSEEVDRLIKVFIRDRAKLDKWYKAAIKCFKLGKDQGLPRILDAALKHANMKFEGRDKYKVKCYDALAAFYVHQARKEVVKGMKDIYFNKANNLYLQADKINNLDPKHMCGKAFLSLHEGNTKLANSQFNDVLNISSGNFKAAMGKARIAFNAGDYTGALALFRVLLRTQTKRSADIRLGIGICLFRLGHMKKAKLAFNKAIEIDPMCIGALVGLGLIGVNSGDARTIKTGIDYFVRAYKNDKYTSMVLNHLANHFFYKKEQLKVRELSVNAYHSTQNDPMRAESCYNLGRSYHIKGEYDEAYKYYYQSTQFTHPNFVLNHYRLGQMCLFKKDYDLAIRCFKTVLDKYPENIESMRLLALLYIKTKKTSHNDQTKEYLMKVVQVFPNDLEAWGALAKILEKFESSKSLESYEKAVAIMKKGPKASPEIYNNFGTLLYRFGKFEEAEVNYKQALDIIDTETTVDHYKAKAVTIRYNLARIYEALHHNNKAEELFKLILSEVPSYVDCYLRLGDMARNENKLYEASDWFKEALQVQQDNADAWSLIGKLHILKEEWGPAQKKYEFILKNTANTHDVYSLIALGNIYLKALYNLLYIKDDLERYQRFALKMYYHALKIEPNNIWASNGIGCILAYKGEIDKANYLFSEVRDAAMDFPEVWINLANIHYKRNKFHFATQLYNYCLDNFSVNKHQQVLVYLANIHYIENDLQQSKECLERAYHMSPQNNTLLYYLALVFKNIGLNALLDNQSRLKEVCAAFRYLKMAERFFLHLSAIRSKSFKHADILNECKVCKKYASKEMFYIDSKMEKEKEELRMKEEIQMQKFKAKIEERRKIEQAELLRKQNELEIKRLQLELLMKESMDIKTLPLNQNQTDESIKDIEESKTKIDKKSSDSSSAESIFRTTSESEEESD